jgi:hypothetical protein
MKKVTLAVALVLLLVALALPAFATSENATDNYGACWGQATAVFAQMGEMGDHASDDELPLPREGLGNLARRLYNEGVLAEPTIQDLAAWLVSLEPDLTIDACMQE